MSRELLELAAKAAGYDVQPHCNYKHSPSFVFVYRGKNWNPLEDDGDCARMETALELSISIGEFSVTVTGKGGVYVDEYYKHHNGDKDKARRYASTRLAAEIGKAMGK